MTQSSISIFDKYTKSRLRSIEEDKYSVIDNIHYMIENDKKSRSLIMEIITDAVDLSGGKSFSVDDLFNKYDGPYVEIVDNLKKFIDIVCFKHRAEEAYCRRMVCLIISLCSNGDLDSAIAAYRFFSYSSKDLAARINAPSILGSHGGRPASRHKAEACEIAKSKWEQMAYASVNVVATTVKHQLDKSYTDAPSVAAIKKWLNSAGIAPRRSAK
ncbi:hypothetical protein ABW09_18395 [Pluralibacter gergoviae]|uniref:hypothetical protein n=1 Tax=Pluralibacter gergoviae TaxID=61647 RepID=UPI000650FF70|nr:hypothetical protein [Pluralibacter gergoviae]KMK16753.1 hypothetical protein ABW09_18395 [Pluralibacter gergoviae]